LVNKVSLALRTSLICVRTHASRKLILEAGLELEAVLNESAMRAIFILG